MQFQISFLEAGKESPKSSRLEFLEKFYVNNFALSDAEDNIYEPLSRRGTTDLPCREHYWQFAKSPASQVSRK